MAAFDLSIRRIIALCHATNLDGWSRINFEAKLDVVGSSIFYLEIVVMQEMIHQAKDILIDGRARKDVVCHMDGEQVTNAKIVIEVIEVCAYVIFSYSLWIFPVPQRIYLYPQYNRQLVLMDDTACLGGSVSDLHP